MPACPGRPLSTCAPLCRPYSMVQDTPQAVPPHAANLTADLSSMQLRWLSAASRQPNHLLVERAGTRAMHAVRSAAPCTLRPACACTVPPAEALDGLSRAGHLYSRGNYEQATELARQLVLDAQARKTMAAAARSETETLGWMAAIRRVRDMQYGRAVATFRAHKRCASASASASASGLSGCWLGGAVLAQGERRCGSPAGSRYRRTASSAALHP